MELTLYRFQYDNTSTLGKLYNGDHFVCFILEDKDRGLTSAMDLVNITDLKVKSQTAIPYGRYEVDITMSKRFGKPLPLIKDVKGFDGIRIHSGNTVEDTEGCLLTGTDYNEEGLNGATVSESRKAFDVVFKLIGEALVNEQVFITVRKI